MLRRASAATRSDDKRVGAGRDPRMAEQTREFDGVRRVTLCEKLPALKIEADIAGCPFKKLEAKPADVAFVKPLRTWCLHHALRKLVMQQRCSRKALRAVHGGECSSCAVDPSGAHPTTHRGGDRRGARVPTKPKSRSRQLSTFFSTERKEIVEKIAVILEEIRDVPQKCKYQARPLVRSTRRPTIVDVPVPYIQGADLASWQSDSSRTPFCADGEQSVGNHCHQSVEEFAEVEFFEFTWKCTSLKGSRVCLLLLFLRLTK